MTPVANNVDVQWARGLGEHTIKAEEIVSCYREHQGTFLGMMEAMPAAIKLSQIARPTLEQDFGKGTITPNKFTACMIDNWLDEKVYAVYTLNQANTFEQGVDRGIINRISWYRADVPESFLKEVYSSFDLGKDMEIISYEEWEKRMSRL